MLSERTKQLAEQAMGTRKHQPPVWQFFDSELEELVNLVVKECVRRIEGCHLLADDDHTLNDFESGYNRGVRKCASQVLLHFKGEANE